MLNNNLKTFMTVAELGSLTEAAKSLYISQPAISQSIKKLEEELDIKLFQRTKRGGIVLTEAGKEILALAYQLTDLENKIYQVAFKEKHLLGGVVRIASVPLGLALFVAPILPLFKQRFPQVQVQLFEGNPLEVKQRVQSFQADIGISTSPYLDLQHLPLLLDRIISVDAREAMDIDLHKDADKLILCRVAYDSVREQLAGKNIDLSRSMVVDAASTQINLIANGNGSGLVSELMLSTIPNKLFHGTLKPAITTEISLIAQDFRNLSPAAKEIVGMLQDKSKELEKI